ncbi:intradiol ring-cleavage dioxygenase [Streptomyces sp. ISL-66]|uniref:dioxygenase family protein n=1 Tax=Streptomyces sp. ISL-66 TaxID=2819186 RepID=UPI001BE54E5D|nr:intradiol ring-cleavage dioxygenase [Streptomyces sp. ISL-66]MBT2472140.1 intradiol ring-cleavage dioxygenase [Streptomyces sp. ISL-66]
MRENDPSPTSRRAVLLAAGTAGVATLASAFVATAAGNDPEQTSPFPSSLPGATTPACVLTTVWGAGPYYLDLDRVRSDITDDRQGIPFRLDFTIVRTSQGCRPLEGAAVDVWQADAAGDYSSNGATYLRGTQITDHADRCTFHTIVPGWYAELAPHIHFKVRPDNHTETSSQLFFPEDLLKELYTRRPYAQRQVPEQPNGRDDRYRASGASLTLAPTADGDGYRAAYTVGIA